MTENDAIAREYDERFSDCSHDDWSNGKRQCPYKCGIHCERNAQLRLAQGERLSERLQNLTKSDFDWLYGIGEYGQ